MEGAWPRCRWSLEVPPFSQLEMIDVSSALRGLWVGGVYLPDLTPLVSRSVRLPRRACSSSKALNRELKLPAPKPCGDRRQR